MKTRMYLVESPEQLKALNRFCKHGATLNLASVWNVMRRKAITKHSLDGRVKVLFRGDQVSRSATVVRTSASGEHCEFASLKYTPALQWCQENLPPAG